MTLRSWVRERGSGARASCLMTSLLWKTELCCRLHTDWRRLHGQSCSVRPVAADQPHSALPRSPPCSDSCRLITVSLCSGNSAKVIINNRLLLYFALAAFPWRRKQNNSRAVRDTSWRRWLDVSRLCELFLLLTLPLLWIISVDSMSYWNGYGFTRTQDLVGSITHIF